MTERYRLTPEDRRAVILDAARDVAAKNGGDPLTITLRATAAACRLPTSVETVKYHFGTVTDLRAAVATDPK